MRNIFKILLFCIAFVLVSGCSAKRLAERKVRRAVELCPELVQLKAHPIDTTLTAHAFTDHTEVPIMSVLLCDSIITRTDHGKVTLRVDREEGTLKVDFTADPQQVRYQDTIQIREVTVRPKEKGTGWTSEDRISLWTCIFLLGAAVAMWLLRDKEQQ